METNSYAIIHKNENYLINTIVWDGKTYWKVPEDCIVVPLKDVDLSKLNDPPNQNI